MLGSENPQTSMFSYVDLEARIPQSHPIRKVKLIVEAALEEIEQRFETLYSKEGRPSIPPKMLIRASLLQILFTIRSERQLCERIDYDLMFRWFVGLGIDDPVWNHSTFSKNRERLMSGNIDEWVFNAIKNQAYARDLLSRDHFSLDGTLLEASASLKSFRPKSKSGANDSDDDHNQGIDFHGEKRSNATHQSTTDPDSKLFRKGLNKEAKLCYMGHIVSENRNGLIVEAEVSQAGTSQEWNSGIDMLAKQSIRPGQTVGADKGYDNEDFVVSCRALQITPHVAAKVSNSNIDGRTTSTEGYRISQLKRKKVEECFGWLKVFGTFKKLLVRGIEKVRYQFFLGAAAYNITRLKNLI